MPKTIVIAPKTLKIVVIFFKTLEVCPTLARALGLEPEPDPSEGAELLNLPDLLCLTLESIKTHKLL